MRLWVCCPSAANHTANRHPDSSHLPSLLAWRLQIDAPMSHPHACVYLAIAFAADS